MHTHPHTPNSSNKLGILNILKVKYVNLPFVYRILIEGGHPLHSALCDPDGLLFGRLLGLLLLLIQGDTDGALRVVERRLVLCSIPTPLVPILSWLVDAISEITRL